MYFHAGVDRSRGEGKRIKSWLLEKWGIGVNDGNGRRDTTSQRIKARYRAALAKLVPEMVCCLAAEEL
jgi:hypothetical protein